MFRDRADAAQQLAAALEKYSGDDVVVLGIPRGGVEIAYHVAKYLRADLSLLFIRKLGYPHNPETAFGSIDEDGGIFLFEEATNTVTEEEMNNVINAERKELARRIREFRKGKPLPELSERTVIIVDDGIATGASMLSAVRSIRERDPNKLVVAIAVAPPSSLGRLEAEADDVVCLHAPEDFYAVGQFFEDFSEVTDDMVVAALAKRARSPARLPQ